MYFLLGATAYTLYMALSGSKQAQVSWWYIPVGLCIALAANICWLLLAKNTQNPNELLLNAIGWDVMVVTISIITPILLFGARLNAVQWVGVAAILTGLLLTHRW